MTILSLSASHGFFRGYRNSRTWGTGEQRKARTLGIARMGRQQGDDNSIEGCNIEYLIHLSLHNSCLGPSQSPECSPCSPSSVSGPVCGTDGKTYTSQCHLKQVACKMIRRQGEIQESQYLYQDHLCRQEFPEFPALYRNIP